MINFGDNNSVLNMRPSSEPDLLKARPSETILVPATSSKAEPEPPEALLNKNSSLGLRV